MRPEQLGPSYETPPHLQVQLARVALLSTPADEMLFPQQDFVRYLDVIYGDPDGPVIGNLHVQYFPIADLVHINNVKLDRQFRRQGLGVEIYRSVPFLPPIEGTVPEGHNIRFISDKGDSRDGKRVWKSLARHGLAERVGRSVYQFRNDAPRPPIMIVAEILDQ
jgi:GNAT superfamily N-acetyltransferase